MEVTESESMFTVACRRRVLTSVMNGLKKLRNEMNTNQTQY